jgi:hypothetical protein
MAATYRTSSAGGASSGSSERTITITPAVGDLLVIFGKWSGVANIAATCTDDNGGAYHLILTALNNSSADMMAIWVRTALMVNTTSTVISPIVGSNTAGEIVCVHVAGMTRTGAGAIRQSGKQENQTTGVPTPALPANALTANLTIMAAGSTTTAGCVPNGSWAERQDVNQASPTTAIEVSTRDSGFTGTSAAYVSIASSVWSSAILEFDGSVFDAALASNGSADSVRIPATALPHPQFTFANHAFQSAAALFNASQFGRGTALLSVSQTQTQLELTDFGMLPTPISSGVDWQGNSTPIPGTAKPVPQFAWTNFTHLAPALAFNAAALTIEHINRRSPVILPPKAGMDIVLPVQMSSRMDWQDSAQTIPFTARPAIRRNDDTVHPAIAVVVPLPSAAWNTQTAIQLSTVTSVTMDLSGDGVPPVVPLAFHKWLEGLERRYPITHPWPRFDHSPQWTITAAPASLTVDKWLAGIERRYPIHHPYPKFDHSPQSAITPSINFASWIPSAQATVQTKIGLDILSSRASTASSEIVVPPLTWMVPLLMANGRKVAFGVTSSVPFTFVPAVVPLEFAKWLEGNPRSATIPKVIRRYLDQQQFIRRSLRVETWLESSLRPRRERLKRLTYVDDQQLWFSLVAVTQRLGASASNRVKTNAATGDATRTIGAVSDRTI